MKLRTGPFYRRANNYFRVFCRQRCGGIDGDEINGSGGGKRVVPIVARSSFGALFVGIILLMKLLAELAFAIAVHPGLVLIDAIFQVGRSVDVIVGNNKIPAECLCKEGQ